MHVCVLILWPLRFNIVGCWSLAFIGRIIYKFFNVCPFDYTAFAISGKVGIDPVNQFNHTSWVAIFTPTDRPKSAIVV